MQNINLGNCKLCGNPFTEEDIRKGEKVDNQIKVVCQACGNRQIIPISQGNKPSQTPNWLPIIIGVCVVAATLGIGFGIKKGNSGNKRVEVPTTQSESITFTEATTEKSLVFPHNVVFNEETGHHYAVYDFTEEGLIADFDAWEIFCERQGGYLAVINDKEENDFLYQYLKDSGLTLAFFGYTDQNSEGKWTWVNGRSSTYTNWAKGQPNDGANNEDKSKENYAQFYKETADGKWNDSKIAVNSYKFICEWDD